MQNKRLGTELLRIHEPLTNFAPHSRPSEATIVGDFLDNLSNIVYNYIKGHKSTQHTKPSPVFEPLQYILADAYVDVQFGAAGMAFGMIVGSLIPIPATGTAIGAVAGFLLGSLTGMFFDALTEELKIIGGKTVKQSAKETARNVADFLKFW